MHKKNKFYHWGILAAWLLLSGWALVGCKTSQSISYRTTPAFQDSLSWAQNYQQDLRQVKARFSLRFHGNQFINLKGDLFSVQGEELYISLQALFGWEILQLYCTPTEAVVVDKIKKRVCTVSFAELAPELGVDFAGLQALLTQKMFDPAGKDFVDFSIHKTAEKVIYQHRGKYLTEFVCSPSPLLQRTRIESFQQGSRLLVDYASPVEHNGFTWSEKMEISFSSKYIKQSLICMFALIKLNDKTNIDWKFPENYQRVSLSQIKREINAL